MDTPASRTPTALPGTEDPAIDAALGHLAGSTSGTLDDVIEAGERVQRVLQGRLEDTAHPDVPSG